MLVSAMLTLRAPNTSKHDLFLLFTKRKYLFPNYHDLGQFSTKKYRENGTSMVADSTLFLARLPRRDDARLTGVSASSRLSDTQVRDFSRMTPPFPSLHIFAALWSSRDNKEGPP